MPSQKKTTPSCCETASKDTFADACVEALRESGARVTQPRLLVIDCLAKASKPLNAREVHEAISKDKKAADVDQVSVYRVLEALLELDLIHQVFPSGGYMACFHKDCSSRQHVIIRCSSCEEIRELDVPIEAISPILSYLKKEQGFSPDHHFFQMNGLCDKCQ